MIMEVPSALCANRFERACGAPSMIHCGRIGSSNQLDIGWSGENHGFGQGRPLSHAAQPLNRSSPNKT